MLPLDQADSTVSGNSARVGGGGIANSGTLTLTNSTVSGNSADFGGGVYDTGTLTLTNSTVSGNSADFGGGVYDTGTLTLTNSTVSGNSAYYGGGGILNEHGTLTLTNSTVSGNSAFGYNGTGGGIANIGTLTLNNCTVSGNSAPGGYAGVTLNGHGGGIFNDYGSTLTLNSCTVSGNSAGRGGGIYNSANGTVVLNNTTVSDNTADWYGYGEYDDGGFGGGIENYSGTLTLNNSTVSGNRSNLGGGILNSGTLHARNTIIAGNTAYTAPDLSGNLGSLGHNLIGNDSGGSGFDPTDLRNVNPLLGPLQDNGGPTKTMALLVVSPAINAGDPAQLGVADQRGVVRSGGVNIGAYQASASAFVLTAPATATAGTAFDLTVKAIDPFGQTAFGYTGTAHFSSADGQAVLPGDYTFTSGAAGVHSFPGGVTLKTAGSQTITATDTGTGSLTGSATVMVTPAVADHILLSGPASASAGVPFDLVVTIQDQYGNTITGYTGTVHFTTDDPAGTLPDDYTFTAEDAGSHTFVGGVTLYTDSSRITVTDTLVETLTDSLVIRLA